jgi:galactokinase
MPNRLFVPGRLCLLGEHSDWAGAYRTTDPALAPGYCLVTGTDQGLSAEAEPAADVFEISTVLPGDATRGPERVRATADRLDAAARDGGFFSYVAGVAAEMVQRYAVGGLRVRITAADLPIAKGLSSSAAACVLVARAFNQVYALGLSTRDEMDLAYAGERRAGSACGFMDQVCAFGQATVLLTFDGEDRRIEAVTPGGTIHLLVVDLGGAKDTRRILRDLNACFPASAGAIAARVRETLGPLNAAFVARGREAVIAGDARALGAVMDEAQDTFDRLVAPACPELAAPRLHQVLADPAVAELGWGAKGVGSQGDGSAQIVCRGDAERAALSERLARALGVRCLPLTLRTQAQ